MPILYSLIARQKSVLAEFTSSSGNFPTVTRVLLAKIPEHDSKMSYVYDNYVFHYIVDQGITFLCMSDESTKRRITFAFLEDIKKVWRENYLAVERTALPFSMNEAFSPVLRQKIEFYNSNPTSDNISKVQAQIDTVKDVMIENIDRVLERGERIELLVDKTDRLNHQAFKFEKTSRTLKNTMYYRKIRNIAILVVFVALIIFFIVAIICGFDFKNC
mmetsp:Transcript_11688/g.23613  ORF Transcript_11688/g.23613 Transcript_11688/m.23613 type:complete len:217 (+) Transcript_11688:49-699(+)